MTTIDRTGTSSLIIAAVAELVLLAALPLGPAGWIAGVCYATALLCLLGAALHRTSAPLGPADQVTLARATLVGGILALAVDGSAPRPLLVVLATVALVLDAVDGQVARRTGTSSPLGARFDMEVDAFLILVLSAYVAVDLGLWVLAIGAMRYVFVVAARAWPWLAADLPPRRSGKVVAAWQGVTLTAAASDVFPLWLTTAGAALSLALLTASFARDVAYLRSIRPLGQPRRATALSSPDIDGG